MIVKKKAGTYNVYTIECSWGELQAARDGLASVEGPLADEARAALDWYVTNEVPPPGSDTKPSEGAGADDKGADELLPDVDAAVDAGAESEADRQGRDEVEYKRQPEYRDPRDSSMAGSEDGE